MLLLGQRTRAEYKKFIFVIYHSFIKIAIFFSIFLHISRGYLQSLEIQSILSAVYLFLRAMKNCNSNTFPARCAILMSGSGSNAEALLEFERSQRPSAYETAVLVTDAPETSRAREIASKYSLPLVEHDIRKFYRDRGEDSIKLDCPRRREIRNEWSDGLLQKIMEYKVNFACFAGFVPLSNIAGNLPCLNVHPGDLTRCDEAGNRIYAGLHILPVERAILNGEKSLRSSVILVQPYTGSGAKEMDAGPIVGISSPLPVDLEGHTLTELAQCSSNRIPGTRCRDVLRELALAHIERLKTSGDHIVFPRAAADFASGAFKCDSGQLFYKGAPVLSVEYSTDKAPRKITL